MQENEKHKTWGHAFAIWWAMAWRMAFWFFVIMAALMLLLEFLGPFNLELKHTIENAAVVILVPVLGIYATRAVLNRNYGSFRLSLTEAKRRHKDEPGFERGLLVPIQRLLQKLGGRDAAEEETTGKDAAPQQEKRKKSHTNSAK